MRRFLEGAGWARRLGDAASFARMMAASRSVVAWEGDEMVGFARALSDGVSNGYLSMVAVAEPWRGRGVGRALVQELLGEDDGVTWVVRAGRGSEGFWAKLGFAPSSLAMEKPRAPRRLD